MNTALLWIVTLLYAGQASIWLYQRMWSDAAILCGYVIANVGLIVKVQG